MTPALAPEEITVPQRPPRLSLRRNFGWTFGANVIYAGCQWGMLVALAKIGSPALVGQFVLGLAVTAPIMLFSGLQLRAAQASDSGGLFGFRQYLALRAVSTTAGVVMVAGLVLLWRHSATETAVIFAITGAKTVEAFIEQFYGLFQQHERMDFIARSLVSRGVLAVSSLACILYLTGSVFLAALGIAGANIVVFLAHDVPRSRCLIDPPSKRHAHRSSIWRLALDTLPLGFVSMLMSLNPNIPRYFVEHYLGSRPLGIFGAIAYLHVVGNTAVSALCESAIPRLSSLRDSGRMKAFRGLLLRVVGVAAAIGICAVLTATLFGRLLLSMFYGPEYAKYSDVLRLQMTASALIFTAASMMAGLTAARRFAIQLPLWGSAASITALCCALLIPGGGLRGAGTATVTSAAIQATVTAITVIAVLKRATPREYGWKQ